MASTTPWRVFYVFESFPLGSQAPMRLVASPAFIDLYTLIRQFGVEAGLGRYRRMDTDPDSPTIGLHLFQRGSVKLSIIPTQGTIHDV